MKVRDLLERLAKADPDAEVVVPAFDHSYGRVGRAAPAKAEALGKYLGEWHGPEHARDGSTVVDVFVIEW